MNINCRVHRRTWWASSPDAGKPPRSVSSCSSKWRHLRNKILTTFYARVTLLKNLCSLPWINPGLFYISFRLFLHTILIEKMTGCRHRLNSDCLLKGNLLTTGSLLGHTVRFYLSVFVSRIWTSDPEIVDVRAFIKRYKCHYALQLNYLIYQMLHKKYYHNFLFHLMYTTKACRLCKIINTKYQNPAFILSKLRTIIKLYSVLLLHQCTFQKHYFKCSREIVFENISYAILQARYSNLVGHLCPGFWLHSFCVL